MPSAKDRPAEGQLHPISRLSGPRRSSPDSRDALAKNGHELPRNLEKAAQAKDDAKDRGCDMTLGPQCAGMPHAQREQGLPIIGSRSSNPLLLTDQECSGSSRLSSRSLLGGSVLKGLTRNALAEFPWRSR